MPTSTTQNQQKATISSVWVGIALTLVSLSLVAGFWILISPPVADEDMENSYEEVQIVPITTSYPEYAIAIPPKNRRSPEIQVDWVMVREDLAYYVEINGGTNHGGAEILVPARKDWDRVGYNPETNQVHWIKYLRFKLAPGQKVTTSEINLVTTIIRK